MICSTPGSPGTVSSSLSSSSLSCSCYSCSSSSSCSASSCCTFSLGNQILICERGSLCTNILLVRIKSASSSHRILICTVFSEQYSQHSILSKAFSEQYSLCFSFKSGPFSSRSNCSFTILSFDYGTNVEEQER